jgi:hypothetical protein
MQMWTKAIGIRCGILPQRGVPELMIVLRGMVYNPAAQGKVLNDVAGVLEGRQPAPNNPGAAAAPVPPPAIQVNPVEPLADVNDGEAAAEAAKPDEGAAPKA